MSKPNPTNYAHSVFTRLKNLAKQKGYFFNQLLIRYATERFLYRLSVSAYAAQFVLKGGNLFIIWQNGWSFRPTIDSDLLCFGQADEEHLKIIFRQLCSLPGHLEDGMSYDANSITISTIREDTEYGGTRIVLNAFLGNARIPLQFDIGIGDAITPAAETAYFPVLLGGLSPKLKIYPKETSIAEKAEAMITKGFANSRMKDFYDIWLLSELFNFGYKTLRLALCNTFKRRNIPLPGSIPECFSDEFMMSLMKQTQWNAFIRKNQLRENPGNFYDAALRIKSFLLPVLLPRTDTPTQWKAAQGWE